MKDQQRRLLIDLLLNVQASIEERDDAAMDLEAYSGREVVEALLAVAKSEGENEELIDSCLESLGGIWARDGGVQDSLLNSLEFKKKALVEEIIRARTE